MGMVMASYAVVGLTKMVGSITRYGKKSWTEHSFETLWGTPEFWLSSYFLKTKINKREEFVLVHKNPICKEISKVLGVQTSFLI